MIPNMHRLGLGNTSCHRSCHLGYIFQQVSTKPMLTWLTKTHWLIITNLRWLKFNTNENKNNNSMVLSLIKIHPFTLQQVQLGWQQFIWCMCWVPQRTRVISRAMPFQTLVERIVMFFHVTFLLQQCIWTTAFDLGCCQVHGILCKDELWIATSYCHWLDPL